MRIFWARVASAFFAAVGWLLVGLRTGLDIIGWSTAPDDVGAALSRVDQFLAWLFLTPSWMFWGIALFLSATSLAASWPRKVPNISGSTLRTVDFTPEAREEMAVVEIEERLIFISQIRVGFYRVGSNRMLDVAIFGYNASDRALSVMGIRGSLEVKFQKNGNEAIDLAGALPPPYLSDDSISTIAPFSEFLVKIDQRISEELQKLVLNMGDHDRVWVYLDKLDVRLIDSGLPNQSFRLMLWAAVTGQLDSLVPHSHRVIIGSMNAKFG